MDFENFPPEAIYHQILGQYGGARGRYFPQLGRITAAFCTLWCIERILRDLVYYELRGKLREKWDTSIRGLSLIPPLRQRLRVFKEQCLDATIEPSVLELLTLGELADVISGKTLWPTLRRVFRGKAQFEKDVELMVHLRNSIAHGRQVEELRMEELRLFARRFLTYLENFARTESSATRRAPDILDPTAVATKAPAYDNLITYGRIKLRHHDLILCSLDERHSFDFSRLDEVARQRLSRRASFVTEQRKCPRPENQPFGSFWHLKDVEPEPEEPCWPDDRVWLLVPCMLSDEASIRALIDDLGACIRREKWPRPCALLSESGIECYRGPTSFFFNRDFTRLPSPFYEDVDEEARIEGQIYDQQAEEDRKREEQREEDRRKGLT